MHLEVFNALSYSEVFLFPLYAFTKTFLALVHNYFPFRPMWCVFSDKQYNRRQNKIDSTHPIIMMLEPGILAMSIIQKHFEYKDGTSDIHLFYL